MFCSAGASSGGTCGSSWMASTAFCFKCVRAGLDRRIVRRNFGDQIEAGGEKRQASQVVERTKPLLALANQVMHAIRSFEISHDADGRADLVEILGPGLIDGRIALQDDAEPVTVLNGLLDGLHGNVAAERDLGYGAREHDEVSDGDYEQHVLRQLRRVRSFDHLRFFGFVVHGSSGHGLERRIWG